MKGRPGGGTCLQKASEITPMWIKSGDKCKKINERQKIKNNLKNER